MLPTALSYENDDAAVDMPLKVKEIEGHPCPASDKHVYGLVEMRCRVHSPADLPVIKGTNIDRVRIGKSEAYRVTHEDSYSRVCDVPVEVLERFKLNVLQKPRGMNGIGLYAETDGHYHGVPLTKRTKDGTYLVEGTDLVILKENDKVTIDI